MPTLTRSLAAPRRTGAIVELLQRLAIIAKTWQRRARERAQLAALGDRDLRDIGLTRADQLRECSKPFWRA